MEEKIIVDIIKEIIKEDVNDGIEFQYEEISEIIPDSEYNCYSVKLKARFGKINAKIHQDYSRKDICYNYFDINKRRKKWLHQLLIKK